MNAAKLVFTAILLLAICLARPEITQKQVASDKKIQFGMEFGICRTAYAADVPDKCKLFGKIQIVDSFPDVKVQKVDSFPDIKVQWVDSFPDAPGKWQKVNSFPDFKVQFVDSFPDYKVQFVDSFPGCD
jgi:hypothetical protein